MNDIFDRGKLIETTAFNQGIHKTEILRTILAAYIPTILQVNLHITHRLLAQIITKHCITKLQHILHCFPFILNII